jgi:hypothetical protein
MALILTAVVLALVAAGAVVVTGQGGKATSSASGGPATTGIGGSTATAPRVRATAPTTTAPYRRPSTPSSLRSTSSVPPTSPVPPTSSVPATAADRTFPGPDGIEASWVVAENAKPGTTAWRITAQSGPTISGYADHTSAQPGQRVSLYVSTQATSFGVQAYRMGYYGGDGARLIWQSGSLAGGSQATCPVAPETYTVSCDWRRSLSFTVGADWVQGDYLLKLQAGGGQASYVPLTVTDPASHATYVIQNSVLTWQAWNPYGGYDCFQGPTGQLGPTDPIRSRVVSYDRPYEYSYSDGEGAADFLNLEYPAVRFAEEHGLDVTYWTDIDVTEHPRLLEQHKVLISLGHNEFWTAAERQAVVSGEQSGVNLMFLGATPALRPARLTSGPLGPDREMVAYRDAAADPIEHTDPALATANEWADPPLDKPSSEIVGQTYGGYGINASMVITDPTAWPFVHTGVRRGTELPHLILGDYDHYVAGEPGPSDVEILAHSPVTTSYGHDDDSDMIYYSDPRSQAGVFSTGTIGWVGYLNACGPGVPCPTVQAITGNVLRLFGQGPAGRSEPSVSNTRETAGGEN